MKSVGKERKACVFIALISAIWEQRGNAVSMSAWQKLIIQHVLKSCFYFKNLLHIKWKRNNSIFQVPSREEIQGHGVRGVWWPGD